jgi:phosphoribosylformimino-5-aminoimidazole carboxamide ribotide isomerase
VIIYPAIDLRKGRCVRLQQGSADAETVFSDDPTEAARRWASEGAEWLHVVNLDGAMDEPGARNLAALEQILDAVDLPVQFGGGVRSLEDMDHLSELGVERVVLGTVAVQEPQIVEEALAHHGPERICVGIDARDGYVAIHGWLETSHIKATELAKGMQALGVQRVVYTDVRRDGMLSGVNLKATVCLARASGMRVIASGGVASLSDIRRLKAHEQDGIEGVIVGMALYRGAILLPEALKLAEKGEE